MSKAVLISIQPQWCGRIASGIKTVEVRKTRPKLEAPFKCYIYCTKFKYGEILCFPQHKTGKVIGEFVCDRILDICIEISNPDDLPGYLFPGTWLTDKEIMQYLGNGKTGYGWHISDLQIYDKPKELGEFIKPCENDLYCEICAMYSEFQDKCGNKALTLSRPPQSWCYVEELPEGGKGDG